MDFGSGHGGPLTFSTTIDVDVTAPTSPQTSIKSTIRVCWSLPRPHLLRPDLQGSTCGNDHRTDKGDLVRNAVADRYGISPAGFLLAAGIVGLMLLTRKRRRDRQAWEDAT